MAISAVSGPSSCALAPDAGDAWLNSGVEQCSIAGSVTTSRMKARMKLLGIGRCESIRQFG